MGSTWIGGDGEPTPEKQDQSKAARAVWGALLDFQRIFTIAVQPFEEAPLDTTGDWWMHKVNDLRAHILLVIDPHVRSRLDQVADVLAFIETLPTEATEGQSFEAIGYDVVKEGLKILSAYMRGERTPSESNDMRRHHAAAELVRAENESKYRERVAAQLRSHTERRINDTTPPKGNVPIMPENTSSLEEPAQKHRET